MVRSRFVLKIVWFLCLPVLLYVLPGCNPTRHVKDGDYMLRKNTLKIKSTQKITRKGELNDHLSSLVLQKPNKYSLGIPYKVILYNWRYKKYQADSTNFQLKSRTVERPVIYNEALKRKTSVNMRNYLFNQGYFYARVTDTTRFNDKKKMAYVTYNIQTGINYLVNEVSLDISDSMINSLVEKAKKETKLRKGTPFSMSLLETERTRIVGVLRNSGYYKFTEDNITFVVDTFNKNYLRDVANPFESAINFIAQQQQQKKPTLDVKVIIRPDEDSIAFQRYIIGRVTMLPDYADRSDVSDSSMIIRHAGGNVTFRYHKYFVRENVLLKHLHLVSGEYFSQDKYDLTITKLNELGIFQYVRLVLFEDTTYKDVHALRCIVLAAPVKRYDISPNFEVSNGSTYALGSAISLSFRNRNLLKGANMLSVQLSGGIETAYNEILGDNLFQHFYLLSRNFGANASVTFPKFLFPFRQDFVTGRNLPSTIIGGGVNLLDRVNYFTLINTSANFSYNWKETKTKTWDMSPAFINVITLPRIADSFQRRLDSNSFLRNSYKEYFIEGENLSFTYSNQGVRGPNQSYSYLKAGVEEAGGILSLTNPSGNILSKPYAQYVKFDFDLRHYIKIRNSLAAFRFYGGVGIPYGNAQSLPYVKQYFVGGAYSIRGWRVRSLGPGASLPDSTVNYIDRTGDIKFEANGEYRFPILQFFSGSIKLNGAVFADAGNIWLAHSSEQYPDGTLSISTLGRDIAISSGIGARVDLGGFLTIRLDAAFPLKVPYIPQNGGWVVRDVSPFDNDWRKNNLVLQFAIGYPF